MILRIFGLFIWMKRYSMSEAWRNLSQIKLKVCCQLYPFFFLWFWGLNSGPSPWTTPPALFCEEFFEIGTCVTICLGWLRTVILLIPASWVGRITGVSHRWPASFNHIIGYWISVILRDLLGPLLPSISDPIHWPVSLEKWLGGGGYFILIFLAVLGFDRQALYHLSHSASLSGWFKEYRIWNQKIQSFQKFIRLIIKWSIMPYKMCRTE
jgi:hypothetical protein